MSMPTIQLGNIDLQDALNNVLASIALVEAGLSHILNAEGMKIQHAIADPNITIDKLTKLNESVADVATGAAGIESAVKDKLASILPQLSPPPPQEN